jgi:hypothetical protein
MKKPVLKLFVTCVASFCLSTIICNAQKKQVFEGTISNGFKGDKISFTISPDGKILNDLTFNGYWRCSGKLEQTKVGPDKGFPIVNGKVDGFITEPPGGGSTAWRFELKGEIAHGKASGTFRMNINNLGCDTYKLQWTAVKK